jgi:BirA family transcriptional regulator, biotin operon repressor / biotin---[acetyl-CoA-carboxylase] ligase
MALFIGNTLHFFEIVASTNSFAQQLVAQNTPAEGTVIQAAQQTEGRGQLGAKWESNTGQNIMLSIILRPTFIAISSQFLLNQAIALGLIDFLNNYIESGVQLKWPNDILVHGKKISGILIENTIQTSRISSSIVGIGININQVDFENLPQATSLQRETGKQYDLSEIRTKLLDCIEARYLQARAGRKQQIQTDYIASLYRFCEDACYERCATNTVFWGRIIGISQDGRLELLHQHGVEFFSLKEIKFL